MPRIGSTTSATAIDSATPNVTNAAAAAAIASITTGASRVRRATNDAPMMLMTAPARTRC